MVRWLLAMAVLGVMGCTKARDCGFVQNVYGERISWKSGLPVRLKLHESVPEKYVSSIEKAIFVWNQEAGETLFVLDKSEKLHGSSMARKDKVNGIYFYSQWEKDRSFEQARTSVYWVGDRIEEADIRINAADFKFYTDEVSAPDRRVAELPQKIMNLGVHMKSLLVHELGHVLGLRHNDKSPHSVMATVLHDQSVRVALSEKDRQALRCEYN